MGSTALKVGSGPPRARQNVREGFHQGRLHGEFRRSNTPKAVRCDPLGD